MSPEHKKALSEGRRQGRVVRHYLEGLEATKPKRGRKRTKETVESRIESLEDEISDASALKRLELIQERIDLTEELEKFDNTIDMDSLENEFVGVAKDYADRRGISYAAFRAMGIEPRVLKKAGIRRGG